MIDHLLLGTVTASSVTGDAYKCASMWDKWIVASGVAAGSAAVEASADGTNFEPTGVTISAGGTFEIPDNVNYIRIAPTGFTCTAIRLTARV